MVVQCTNSIAPGPGRIRDFRHRLLCHGAIPRSVEHSGKNGRFIRPRSGFAPRCSWSTRRSSMPTTNSRCIHLAGSRCGPIRKTTILYLYNFSQYSITRVCPTSSLGMAVRNGSPARRRNGGAESGRGARARARGLRHENERLQRRNERLRRENDRLKRKIDHLEKQLASARPSRIPASGALRQGPTPRGRRASRPAGRRGLRAAGVPSAPRRRSTSTTRRRHRRRVRTAAARSR